MKLLPNSVTRKIGRKVLLAKKNSPRIFFVAGVAGVAGSTILACRATLKLDEELQTFKADVDAVKKEMSPNAPQMFNEYTTAEYRKDIAYVYARGTLSLAKLYAPAAGLGAVSIASLAGSHIILSRRNTALAAAYAAVGKAYDDYRIRVREELGEERENDIYHSTTLVEVQDENGKKVKRHVSDPNTWSPYARFFDEFSSEWMKDPEYNRMFVRLQQDYANHLLNARGHVFLNEVYDALGLARSPEGQVVGWIRDSSVGDNYIDFGLNDPANHRFVAGEERSVRLDFNVDGVIYDQL